jgi:hypothetical protein
LAGTVHAVLTGVSVALVIDGIEKSYGLAYLEAPISGADQSDSCLEGPTMAELSRALAA